MCTERIEGPAPVPAEDSGVDQALTPVLHGKRIALDPRLSALAALVGRCGLYADIGCDHGRLGAYLLKTGQVGRACLTDISADSLSKARRLIGLLGLSDRVDFRVGDGAKALEEPPEAVVIAGMGGGTIAKIIEEGRKELGTARLILQPNVDAPELRATLCAQGYRICDERIVRDGRRYYVIVCAEPGEAHYNEIELEVGPVLFRDMPPELEGYAGFRLRVAKKALDGARDGGDLEVIMRLEYECGLWKGVLECLPT